MTVVPLGSFLIALSFALCPVVFAALLSLRETREEGPRPPALP